tara:strand:+ start:484 stop:1062 length:579 start_codon:yes stop_codon:yes gene_type:complete
MLKKKSFYRFKIEGFTVGEKLSRFYPPKTIKKNIINEVPNSNKKFIQSGYYEHYDSKETKFLEEFDQICFFYKPNDKNFIIHAVSAIYFCKKQKDRNDFVKTYEKKIDYDWGDLLKKSKQIYKYPNKYPYGKGSKSLMTYYQFPTYNYNNDLILISNKSYAKDANSNWGNNVEVTYMTFEFNDWLAKHTSKY